LKALAFQEERERRNCCNFFKISGTINPQVPLGAEKQLFPMHGALPAKTFQGCKNQVLLDECLHM